LKARFLTRRQLVRPLVVGLLVSTADAWFCAIISPSPGLHGDVQIAEIAARGDAKRCLRVRVWDFWSGTLVQVARLGRLQGKQFEEPKPEMLPSWSAVRGCLPALPQRCEDAISQRQAYEEMGFGFPLTLLRSTMLADYRTERIVQCWGGIRVPRREWFIWGKKDPFRFWKFDTALPLIPTSGFFGMTTLVALLVLAIAALRWRRCRRKGLCPQCGYDLFGNTSGICPECGSEASTRAIARQVNYGPG
jgi:hypothetical protein